MSETISVNTRSYLSLDAAPAVVKPRLAIEITDNAYLPHLDDLESDWLHAVAVPAFKLLRKQRRGRPFGSFAAIGTGPGLDVLAAAEILGASRVGLTDLDPAVVAAAENNVRRNIPASRRPVIQAAAGDLLAPLIRFGDTYDVIYENLPNIPVKSAKRVAVARNSGSNFVPRKEEIPEFVHTLMLDLHYLALVQARDFLAPHGAVLSTIGARVPLKDLLALGGAAGLVSSILTYTWKAQYDPAGVLPGYVRNQRKDFGPFRYYPAAVLAETFAKFSLASSGKRAFDIDAQLAPHALDAPAAYAAFKKGETIGHTVVVLKSERR
jgi:methylase of polypeptide subunit release factors